MGAFLCQEFVQFDEDGKETRNSVYHRIKEATKQPVDAQSVRVTCWEKVVALKKKVALTAEFRLEHEDTKFYYDFDSDN